MEWFLVICFIISVTSLYFSYGSRHYIPEKVLVDMGEQVFISHLPVAKLNKKYGKTIPKSSVTKIQLAGNYVSFFNASDNAVDIWAPSDRLAKPIFEYARGIFKDADVVVINC
ncbi:hypothetical protein [Pseudoalteromonas espejiana]|uniref:Uncharacterized protein n=1 Tax=Pseudoalteromonas espejiana TaxID=28107 RepID=A0A510XUE1_9GAMM|nr:hypothetical protein [Pseudoalteromonas espejiana]GEK54644.1 hypothetical protein PES01_14890 [Pseudoalteromonas espejiana]